jgi:cyclopropane fatty-acyl-phospholipid synthase-like methyltransferase
MEKKESALKFFPRDATHGPIPGTAEYEQFIDDQLTIIKADYLRSAKKLTSLADDIFVEVGKNAVAILNTIMPGRPLRILDICSGIGLATETFIELGVPVESVTLTEQDPRLLERAVEYLTEKGHAAKIKKGIRTDVFDPNIHRLADKAPGEFDLVVSCNAFQHFSCEHQKSLIQQIHDQLSTHGLMVVQSHWKTLEPDWRKSIIEAMKKQMASQKADAAFSERAIRHVTAFHNFVSTSDLFEWCDAAGFSIKEVLYRQHIIGALGAIK